MAFNFLGIYVVFLVKSWMRLAKDFVSSFKKSYYEALGSLADKRSVNRDPLDFPTKGSITIKDLVPGSRWLTQWGDVFVVKSRGEVQKEYFEADKDKIYVRMLPEAVAKASGWPYRAHIPVDAPNQMLNLVKCINTEEEWKEISTKGGQHD